MKHIYFALLTIFIAFSSVYSYTDKDTLQLKTQKEQLPEIAPELLNRSFKQLDKQLAVQYNQYTIQETEFTNEYIQQRFTADSTLAEILKPAVGTFETLDENGAYIDVLTPSDLVELPVGIRETIGGIQYFIGISEAKFTPEYSELTVFVRIILPQLDGAGNQQQLFFGGNHIKLSHQGGLIGDANIVLLGDIPIKIAGGKGLVILKGGMNLKTGDIQDKTYVTIGCDGFKELGIEADVEFPRTMVEPIKANYEVDNTINTKTNQLARVTGNFKTVASDWNDILVEVSLPRFQLTNFKGTVFELNTAIFDFSDLRNSTDIIWPQDYQQYLVPGNENLWRGIYVNSLKVILPKAFKRKNDDQRLFFGAEHMLIDRMGVSGTFSANNLLPINEGSASGWQFSLDYVQASFVANQVVGAGFGGGIVLPISKKVNTQDSTTTNNAVLGYDAIFNPQDNQYILTISLEEELPFDVFSAKGKLDPESYIQLTIADDKFRPKAVLYGELNIGASNNNTNTDNNTTTTNQSTTTTNSKKTVDFKGIKFRNLQIQTEVPYLTVDYFGYQGDVKVGNFPVVISDIVLVANDSQASLEFNLAVNLMKDQFNAQTRLGIVGKFAPEEGFQKWKYDRLTFTQILINAELSSGTTFKGSLTLMDNDPVYGKGFKGSLTATFDGLGSSNAEISANAIFGRTDFRYWYVDALANNLNIPTGAAFTIKGFGGGAFYRMKKEGFSSNFANDASSLAPTGAQYVPDNQSGLGVKAMILFSNQANASVFNGGAGFEIAFNTHGGLNRISFYGEAHFMQPFELSGVTQITDKLEEIQNLESNQSPALLEQKKNNSLIDVSKTVYPASVEGEMGINAYAAIEYDFTTKTLHGSFDVYVDTAKGLIQGRSSGNRAGWAVIHFAPDKWYIHMGTPTDRLGLKIVIADFNIETGGYFMMGDEMPPSPPPPPVVANILGLDADVLDYMRDENALGDGRGLAFGSDFNIDTGDMKFLIFYARFQAGAGFDIMVKDYGNTECQGSGQIGIDGWYANGQAYAYLQGELGIKIKLAFVQKKIPIINAGAAVLLQAKLPNPTWFRGYLGGHYNLLGGLVKGKFRFKIELGKECEMINGSGPLDGLKIIADVSPSDNATEVDVFAIPQAAFNMAIDNDFELEDDDGNTKQYRIKLQEFTLYDENNQEVPVSLQWNENNDVASLRSVDILPPTSSFRVKAKVAFEERQNGIWQTIYENGVAAIEEEERSFTTGVAPDYIPVDNIVYAYPMLDQTYVYPEEYPQGYIKLDRGQPYLFEVDEGWSQESVFTNQNNTTTKGNISYDAANLMVQFDIPELVNQNTYTLSLMTVPTTSNNDENIDETYTAQNLEVEGNTTEVKNTSITSIASAGEELLLLEYQFKTSQYNTFEEKINNKELVVGLREIIASDVHALRAKVTYTEKFSKEELSGAKYSLHKPLIKVEAILDDSYFTNQVNPLVYAEYPLDGNITVNRDINLLGIPPAKAVDKLTWYETYLENDSYSNLLNTRMPYRYYLVYHYKEDFLDLQYQIVNRYLQNPGSYQSKIQQYNYIISGIFPSITSGNYEVRYQYTLPGDIAGTSTNFTYNNPQ